MLLQAASVGKLAMVQFLLENKADPSLQDSFGRTALDEARANGHSNVVAALTEHIKASATAPTP
jgi:ankyrin repeat protein